MEQPATQSHNRPKKGTKLTSLLYGILCLYFMKNSLSNILDIKNSHFDLFNLNILSTPREIARSIRTTLSSYHPDNSTGDEENFLLLTEVKHILIDPTLRDLYIRFGDDFKYSKGDFSLFDYFEPVLLYSFLQFGAMFFVLTVMDLLSSTFSKWIFGLNLLLLAMNISFRFDPSNILLFSWLPWIGPTPIFTKIKFFSSVVHFAINLIQFILPSKRSQSENMKSFSEALLTSKLELIDKLDEKLGHPIKFTSIESKNYRQFEDENFLMPLKQNISEDNAYYKVRRLEPQKEAKLPLHLTKRLAQLKRESKRPSPLKLFLIRVIIIVIPSIIALLLA